MAAGGAVFMAVLAGVGDWRRRSRKDLDKVGLVDWRSVQMYALIAATLCAIVASHT